MKQNIRTVNAAGGGANKIDQNYFVKIQTNSILRKTNTSQNNRNTDLELNEQV